MLSDAELRAVLSDRLAAVEANIQQACQRAGRPREVVQLVAVTKTASCRVTGLLPELGVNDLAENRPQALWSKAAKLPSGIRWHMIGHLQRNKLDKTLPLVCRVHAVDSVRLLEAIIHEVRKRGFAPMPVCLEVNVSREPSKYGFAPAEVAQLPRELLTAPEVRIEGLMTMAAYAEDPEDCRPTFVELRQLRDQLRAAWGESLPLPQLSMGMSNDYPIAIEEGATMIRLGSTLFSGLPGPEEDPA